MAGKKKPRLYYVELINKADSRDNEAAKVSAYSPSDAIDQALLKIRSNFYIGEVALARGSKSLFERDLASELRSICCHDWRK